MVQILMWEHGRLTMNIPAMIRRILTVNLPEQHLKVGFVFSMLVAEMTEILMH